jgi:hypothetical protein
VNKKLCKSPVQTYLEAVQNNACNNPKQIVLQNHERLDTNIITYDALPYNPNLPCDFRNTKDSLDSKSVSYILGKFKIDLGVLKQLAKIPEQ